MDSLVEDAILTKASTPEAQPRAPEAVPTNIDAGELPWAYGDDRITVIVRDPDSAYLYWEITDVGIASARARLGRMGDHGWCNLRIYDTTGRDFDGTNANDYFDLRVDRADREQYLMIRRPSSSMHAEIGVMTHEGYFQPIARSGRGDFPRNGPSPNTTLEWLTITSDDAPPCVAPYQSRYTGPEPPLPGRAGGGYVDAWRAGYAPSAESSEPAREPASWSARRTLDRGVHIERWWRLDEWRAEWRAGLRFLGWQHYDPERVAVELLGETPAQVRVEGGELVVYGPWRMTIRNVEFEGGRRVLSTWSMHWVRATTPLIERWERLVERRAVSAWERVHTFGGASGQDEMREGGSSDLLQLGASERLWLGASEWALGGASETAFFGASGHAAASGWLGASESIGASESRDTSFGGPGDRIQGSPEKWGGRLDDARRDDPRRTEK